MCIICDFVLYSGKKQKKIERRILENLHNLDNAECAVLREFFLQGRNVIRMPIDSPDVVGLRRKGIVVIAGREGEQWHAGLMFPVAISEPALAVLQPNMIGLPDPKLSDAERDRAVQKLIEARPFFCRQQ